MAASDYDYGALAGTYVFKSRSGETCTLHLRPDRTFEQEALLFRNVEKAQGSWLAQRSRSSTFRSQVNL